MLGENQNTNIVENRENRPSGLRFTGVPPLSTIYKNSKNIERTLFCWAEIKTQILSKTVKIDPQEYVLQWFPLPLLCTKTPKTYKERCFDCRILKPEVFQKPSK